MPKDDLLRQIVGIIFLIILIIFVFGYAILYHISIKLFPWFVAFYILSGIGIIVFGILIYFNRDDEPGIFSIIILVSIIVFVISIFGANITGSLIQDIPQTEEGRISLEAWNDLWFLIGLPTYISGEFDRAIQQQLDEICKGSDEHTCEASKNIVKTYKESKELQEWINKGKKLSDFVEAKSGV